MNILHNHNEFEHDCYKCKHCELNHPFNICSMRTTLENIQSNITFPTHYVANCDAYGPREYLNIIHDKLQPLGLSRSETIVSFNAVIDRQLPIDDVASDIEESVDDEIEED